MKTVRILLLSVLFVVLQSSWISPLHSFGIRDYKAGTQNWAIAEQHNGWIYMANNHGLLEYDGYQWRLYSIRNASAVRSVCIDEKGVIYAGGTNEYGYFVPDGNGQLVYHSISSDVPDGYRDFGEVWRIVCLEDKVYIQTRDWLFCHDSEGKVRVIDPAAEIQHIAQVHGNLYVATSREVYMLSRANQLHALHGSHIMQGALVCAILPYKDDVLFATDFRGLFLYNGESIVPFRTTADPFIKSNQLYTATITSERIVLGTVRNGLIFTNLNGTQTYAADNNVLPNNTVLSLLADSQNRLWMGLDCGISVVEMSDRLTHLVDVETNYGSGYACCEYNSELYLGTNQGVYYQTSEKQPLQLVSESLGQVWSLTTIGNTLFCSHHRGLFVIEGHRMRCMIPEGCWSVKKIDNEHAYVGTYHGFYILYREGGVWKVRYLKGCDETALYYEPDGKKTIWMLSHRGILSYTPDEDYMHLIRRVQLENVDAIAEYSISKVGKEIWITGNNHCYYVTEEGELKEDTTRINQLAGIHRYHFINQGEDQTIWYAYDNTIGYRKSDATQATEVFDQDYFFIDGFANSYINHQGNLIVGGITGYYKIQSRKPKSSTTTTTTSREARQPKNTNEKEIYLRQLSIINPYWEILGTETYDASMSTPISLAPGTYTLHFELSSNNHPEVNEQFLTRLYPIEKEFTPYSPATGRDLAALRPGEYRLEVRRIASNCPISEQSYPITIRLPFYRRPIAYLFYTLLLTGFILFGVWLLRRYLRHKSEQIKQAKDYEIQQQQMQILQLEKAKTKYQLKNKSQELSNILLTEVNHKEWNQIVLNDLRKFVHLWNTGNTQEALKLIQSLQERLSSQSENTIDWNRFETNFDIVHEHFIAQLMEDYPWMNKQEQRLCIYIKMGLQSKEIAPLMNISTRGVEMLRYRTRQKMNLPASVNLQKFFEKSK